MPDAVLKIARGFELPLDLVTEATAIVATRGAGKSSTSAVFVEEAFAAHVQSVVFDRTGVYWGLRSNAKGDGAGLGIYVLGGPHGDAPLEPHAGVLIADLVVDSGHSFVLDLSDFSKSAAIRFAADFLERLYDRKARSRSTTMLVLDEAHFYAPQTPRGGFKGDAARLMGAMEDVVGLGRSRGLGVVLTTQRTQSLNKAVLDLIETLLVMRMLSPRARDAVQDWIREKHEDDREGVIATLESLPTGTAWVWSPLRGVLRKVAVRRIRTFDSYATPEPGKVATEPTVVTQLDLAALGEQIRATVERAKENDPAALRARIRDLERQLAAAPAEPVVREVEVERVVEVPVLAAAELLEATTLTNSLLNAFNEIPKLASALAPIARAVEKIATFDGNHGSTVIRPQAARPADPPRVSTTSRRTPEAVTPLPGSRDRPAPEAAPDRGASGGTGGSLDPSQQKVLDAFAWYEALGIAVPTKQQVAIVAGYKSVGGRFGNLLGGLRSRGLVDYPAAGSATMTADGRALAARFDLPHDNTAVQERIMQRLDPSQRRVLSVLIDSYPDPVEKQDAAAATGYTAVGGRFGNLLGSLRSLGLVEYPAPRLVVARDVLFPVR